ncbi:MAG: ABC transporter permease subunit [Prevotella sp.]|nr:ABC transporter permease subunit [Staphylococcus sp.]MCM1350586.1 ABC transporter permease subunit [Prevotella sp.]
MKNILTIIKKEFARFFGDKRLVLTTLILPGLLIFTIYTFMGSAVFNETQVDEDYVTTIYTINAPASFEEKIQPLLIASQFQAEYYEIDDFDENIKDKIKNKEADLCIEFSPDFDNKVAEYDVSSGQTAPYIRMYYNSVKSESFAAYSLLNTIFTNYEGTLTNKFDINIQPDIQFDLATNEDLTATILGMLLPFLILMFLFSGCMAVAPESIAGEKERGTIATLLVTPMKRSELAMGKLMSLSVIAVLCAISSFIGTILSLPNMMKGMGELEITASYQFTDYIWLLLIIISTVLILIGLISVISAYAKSVKEATTLVTPLMIVVMVIGLFAMLSKSTEVSSNYLIYLIPIYNSIKVMGNIFSFQMAVIPVLITIISNVVYASAFVFFLTKMFNSEKVMFSK